MKSHIQKGEDLIREHLKFFDMLWNRRTSNWTIHVDENQIHVFKNYIAFYS